MWHFPSSIPLLTAVANVRRRRLLQSRRDGNTGTFRADISSRFRAIALAPSLPLPLCLHTARRLPGVCPQSWIMGSAGISLRLFPIRRSAYDTPPACLRHRTRRLAHPQNPALHICQHCHRSCLVQNATAPTSALSSP